MFLHKEIPADNLFTPFFDLDHLGFQSGDEIIQTAKVGSETAEST